MSSSNDPLTGESKALPEGIPSTLPTLPENPTTEQLQTALKSKKPTCNGINLPYICGNHDNVPKYSGTLVSVNSGDEIAMNSMIISVVSIDGNGNGDGLIKVPMMGNVKLGLKLEGIKVAEGGCIVEGKANLSGVSLSVLNDRQLEEMQKAYDVFKTAINTAKENADVIAETYNSFEEVLAGVQKKANELRIKLNKSGKATKKEVEQLQALAQQANAQLELSLSLIKKEFDESIQKQMADSLSALIAKNKISIAQLSTYTSSSSSPTIMEAVSNLSAIKPAEVVKSISNQIGLLVDYKGNLYTNGKTIIVSNQDEVVGLELKNITAGQDLSWVIKDGETVLHNFTANPIGLIWPKEKAKLSLEASQGSKKIQLILQRKTFSFTDLVAIDNNSSSRKAYSSKNETLYLVRSPSSSRTVNYKMTTNASTNDFEGTEPTWNTTFPKGGLYEGEVLTKSNSSTAETRHTSEVSGITSATAFDKSYGVKVEVVDQSRHAVDFMPPGTSALLTSVYETTKNRMEQVQRTIRGFVDNFPRLTLKPLKIKGETYNDEVPNSRHYVKVVDGSITAGIELATEKVVFAPPILKPLNIEGIAKVGMYIKPSLDIPIAGGLETKKVYETGKYLLNHPFYFSVAAKGCLEAGLIAELIAAKSLVDFEVRGYGKGCLGGGGKIQNSIKKFSIDLDPVVVGVSAKIKSKGFLTFTLVDTSYEYALTKQINIYETEF